MINDEVLLATFEFLGDDVVQLLRRLGKLHVDAKDAGAHGKDGQPLVSLDAQIEVGQRLQSPMDGDQLVVTKRTLLR